VQYLVIEIALFGDLKQNREMALVERQQQKGEV